MNINLTLIGQLISFALFVWVTMRYVWPPIIETLEERKQEIASGLAAAERGQHEQELAEERAKEVLRDAKSQASDIVAQAQKRALEIIDGGKEDAHTEGERILTAARAEIEHDANRARKQLQETLGRLVVAGAEKILRKEINPGAHQEIIDSLGKQI